MYKVHGTLQGLAPVLYNRWIEDKASGNPNPDDRRQLAMTKVYKNEQGLCICPLGTSRFA